tara:strand:- start:23104 stop:24534 length:1431 start_codon:yes stop_codon:yes gene_type:complete
VKLIHKLKNPIFKIISNTAEKLNMEVYVVGGYVRDVLLNRKNKKNDIDFVCVGSGISLAKEVSQELKGDVNFNYFKNFGTAMIKNDNHYYEFIGARKESYRKNSRKPIIEDGNLYDDQKRRDFNINAMYISLNKNSYGELIDPFNGMSDLKNKIIRTPVDPKKTFSDDPLRMMRAIRFSSELSFSIEKESLNSIIENRHRIEIISKERIIEEFNKILLSNKPSVGLKLLFETKLLEIIFKELSDLQGVENIENFSHKDNFFHTLEVVDNIRKNTDNLWLIWAALLHDIAKPQTKKFEKGKGWTFHGHEFLGGKMTARIFKKLKLPLNEKMKYVQKLVRLHLRPIVLAQDIVTDSAIRRLLFDAGEHIDDLMILCEADITSKNLLKVSKYLNNFKLVRKKLREVEKKDNIRNWKPPINGTEIMKMFNLNEGKDIGVLKKYLKDAILDGLIKNDKKESIEYLNKKFRLLNKNNINLKK